MVRIDQALLCMHLPSARQLGVAEGSPETPRARLRGVGVRTASDLKRCWEALGGDSGFRNRIGGALDLAPDEAAATVEAILRALEGNPSYWHVQEFKRHAWLHADNRRSTRRRSTPVDPVTADRTPTVADLAPADRVASSSPVLSQP